MGENVKSLKMENDKLRNQVKNLSDKFHKFKDMMVAKTNKEVAVVTNSCDKPNTKDVQFLSVSCNDVTKEFKKVESKLNTIEIEVTDIAIAL